MQKHRVNLIARGMFGGVLDACAIDMFGTLEEAEQRAMEYKQAMRNEYGFLCFVSSTIETFNWDDANAKA